MNFITTNIRFPEDDYFQLKEEALRKRKSLAALIRKKIGLQEKKRSKQKVAQIIAETRQHAKEFAKHLKGFNSLKALREIRNGPSW
ncbi:MAG: hypothetical protein Q8Q91_00240 [Candidatus Daviesbacteria bacterium]|nr:hypothetical protein [Candidatus Daviesbacteria bacterium]